MIDNYPTQTGQADKLAQLEADYKAVFATLRTERGFRQAMLNRVTKYQPTSTPTGDKNVDYWLERVNDAQQALDALVRIKDVAKLALLEQRLSVEQQWKQEELIQDVEVKLVRLSY